MPGTYEALDQYNPASAATEAVSGYRAHRRLLLSSSDVAAPGLPQQQLGTVLTLAASAKILVPGLP